MKRGHCVSLVLIIALSTALATLPLAAPEISRAARDEAGEFSRAQIRVDSLGFMQTLFGACRPTVADFYHLFGRESDLEDRIRGIGPQDDLSQEAEDRAATRGRAAVRLPGDHEVSYFLLWLRASFAMDLDKISVVEVRGPRETGGIFRIELSSKAPDHVFVVGHTASPGLMDISWMWIESIDGKSVDELLSGDEITRFLSSVSGQTAEIGLCNDDS